MKTKRLWYKMTDTGIGVVYEKKPHRNSTVGILTDHIVCTKKTAEMLGIRFPRIAKGKCCQIEIPIVKAKRAK